MADFKKVIKGFRQCTLPYTADEYETQCHECPYYNPDLSVKDCTDALKNDVMELLEEQKRGRWTTHRTKEHDGEWYCDQCGYEPTVFEATPYCPNCGAMMF